MAHSPLMNFVFDSLNSFALLAVIGYSFMPPRTFSLWQTPTFLNYENVFAGTSYISFLWSLGLAAITVLLLALIFRGVAFEFRLRDAEHLTFWEHGFAYGSAAATFAQGVGLG